MRGCVFRVGLDKMVVINDETQEADSLSMEGVKECSCIHHANVYTEQNINVNRKHSLVLCSISSCHDILFCIKLQVQQSCISPKL